MTDMTLYEITGEIEYLRMLAEDPETDPQVLEETMEGLNMELEEKAEGYVVVMKELEAQADMFGKEIERLTDMQNKLQNNVKRMKAHLMSNMQNIGMDKLQTEHFKVSVAKNGGLQPLKLSDIKNIPEEYLIREPKADTKKIRDALAAGKELDFAVLEPRGVHLNIR